MHEGNQAEALIFWVVMLGLPHHMHSWARITLGSIPKAWQRCSCSTAGGNSWVEMYGQTLLPWLGFDDVETSWVPHASWTPKRCWNQRLLGKSFNPIINSKIFMQPNKKGTDLLRENGIMKSIFMIPFTTTGKAVVDDSFLPQAHCSPQEGNYRAVCSKNDAPHCPEPSGSA